MNIAKLLVQDNPPTRSEWNALNQGIKNWTLYALVDRDAITVQLIQHKPYTALQLAFDAGEEIGEYTHLGNGFSKVCHPDVYNATIGVRIARVRATRMIVKALIRDDMAYSVLIDKWDRYQDTVEGILSAAGAEAGLELDANVGVDLADEGGDQSVGTCVGDPTRADPGECKSSIAAHDEYFTGDK